MPYAIPHPCPHCGALVTKSYCDEYLKAKNDTYEQGRRERDKRIKALYDCSRYQRARLAFIKANPICMICEKAWSEELDHKTPIKKGKTWAEKVKLFWSKLNWQSACKPCHSKKSAEEGSRWGNTSHQ